MKFIKSFAIFFGAWIASMALAHPAGVINNCIYSSEGSELCTSREIMHKVVDLVAGQQKLDAYQTGSLHSSMQNAISTCYNPGYDESICTSNLILGQLAVLENVLNSKPVEPIHPPADPRTFKLSSYTDGSCHNLAFELVMNRRQFSEQFCKDFAYHAVSSASALGKGTYGLKYDNYSCISKPGTGAFTNSPWYEDEVAKFCMEARF